MKYQDSNSALTRFDQSFGGHVPVGNDGDDDDDACLPPRSVFPISFDCLDSQMVGPEDKMHVGSNVEGSQDVGSFEGQTVGFLRIGKGPDRTSLVAIHHHRRQDDNDDH